MKITRTSKHRHAPKVLIDALVNLGFEHDSGAMEFTASDENYYYEVSIDVRALLEAAGWAISDFEKIRPKKEDE